MEVISFDHHRATEPKLPDGRSAQRITSEDGALTTLMLRILAERSLPVTPLEATVFALGIHEDTGSLTFTSSTSRDAEALAYCMRQGASPALIERYLHSPLSETQRDLLARALVAAEPAEAGGVNVMVAALEAPEYVEEVAVVAHRYLEVTGCDAFVLLVRMEQRVFVIARSRSGALDVAAALEPVGGGGHRAAASAVLREMDLAAAREAVVAGVRAAGERSRTAHDVDLGRRPLGGRERQRRRSAAPLPSTRAAGRGRGQRRPPRRLGVREPTCAARWATNSAMRRSRR